MRPGLEILDETPGTGAPVRRHAMYNLRLRLWLHRGDAVRWSATGNERDRLEDDGATLFTTKRVHRRDMIPGLFQGIEGMRVGGMRRLSISPHLAYGERGVPDQIPPQALLIIEVQVLAEYEPPANP